MEAMRESWTDRRLDDFAAHTGQRFDALERRMKDGFDRVDTEMKEGFARVDAEMKEGFARVDADIRDLRTQMAAFQRMVLQLGGGMVVTFALGFAGLILAQL
jgi:hypothetical protein